MYSHPPSLKRIAPFLLFLILLSSKLSGFELNESERLAVAKKWLPHYHNHLQLLFEYDSEKEHDPKPNAEQLHKAIDKAGPTVTILEVQTAYETESRIIGGYNPYRWKTWYGHYESNAGQFVFDIGREKRWERTVKRAGSFKSPAADYGLALGGGDLVINPDLTTGSARNTTFSDNPTSSVLTGQAGDFLIKNLRVYQVVTTPEAAEAVIPMANRYHEPPASNPIPDSSTFLFEISLSLIALGFLKSVSKRN